MTQRNPIAPGRRLIATGLISRTPNRTLKLVATAAGTTGSIAKRARVTELHRLAREDYTTGEAQRAAAAGPGLYTAFTPAPAPNDLATSVAIAQRVLSSDEIVPVREALRLVLRALGAEPTGEAVTGR